MQRRDTEKEMGPDPLLPFSVFREALRPFPQLTSRLQVGGHKSVSLVQGSKLSVHEGSAGPPLSPNTPVPSPAWWSRQEHRADDCQERCKVRLLPGQLQEY